MACVCVITHRIQRTIFTPIPTQQAYYDLDRTAQQLIYRTMLLPPTPQWEQFLPWRDDLGSLNLVCFPFLLLFTALSLIGLVVAPVISLVMLLCCPLMQLCQAQCCLECTSDYRGEQRQQYYEIKLQAMAGYPIDYCTLDSVTEELMAYLSGHGVTVDQVFVRDGFGYGERPDGCATIPASALTGADMAALQAHDQQQQQQMQMAPQQQHRGMEEGGVGRRADDRADSLLHAQHSDSHAYRLNDAAAASSSSRVESARSTLE